jgi:hypothetical protein
MASPELERLWQDPAHWSPPGIYRCAEDSRLIVPKRRRWAGWTLNFAHRGAWLVFAGSVAVAVGPLLTLLAFGRPGVGSALVVLGGSVLAIVLASAWESERTR